MNARSLLTVSKYSARRVWECAVRYANSELEEDHDAVREYVARIKESGFVRYKRIEGGFFIPVPGNTEQWLVEARHLRPKALIVLRWFADSEKRADDKVKAAEILTEHTLHYGHTFSEFPDIEANVSGQSVPIERLTDLLAAKLGTRVRTKRNKSSRIKWLEAQKGVRSIRRKTSEARTLGIGIQFLDLLDPICMLVAQQVRQTNERVGVLDRLQPIRSCSRTGCHKLFVRNGRREHCCSACKKRHDWERDKGPTRANAFYMFRRRADSVPPDRLPNRIARVRKMKIGPEEKRRRIQYLKHLPGCRTTSLRK